MHQGAIVEQTNNLVEILGLLLPKRYSHLIRMGEWPPCEVNVDASIVLSQFTTIEKIYSGELNEEDIVLESAIASENIVITGVSEWKTLGITVYLKQKDAPKRVDQFTGIQQLYVDIPIVAVSLLYSKIQEESGYIATFVVAGIFWDEITRKPFPIFVLVEVAIQKDEEIFGTERIEIYKNHIDIQHIFNKWGADISILTPIQKDIH